MARSKRAWSALRTDVRSILGEDTAASSQWSDALLLLLFNSSLDARLAQMADVDEDWMTATQTINLVAGTASYALSAGTNNVKRVLRVRSSGGVTIETPLERLDRWRESAVTAGASNSSDDYRPTYRLFAGNIVLDPPPAFAQTGGLKVEHEPFIDRFSADGNTLPDAYPDILETLLVWDTVISAMRIEGTMGESPEGFFNHVMAQRQELERQFISWIEKRQKTPTSSIPYHLGG